MYLQVGVQVQVDMPIKGTPELLRKQERIAAFIKAIEDFEAGKFYEFYSQPILASNIIARTICDFDGHIPQGSPPNPHHLPTCTKCHEMLTGDSKLKPEYTLPKALKCDPTKCWRCKTAAAGGVELIKATSPKR